MQVESGLSVPGTSRRGSPDRTGSDWAVEVFDDCALAMHGVDGHVLSLSGKAADALRSLAREAPEPLRLDAGRLAALLAAAGDPAGLQMGGAMETMRHVQNPDVNLREEDDDGALLFNPDTDAVELLNATGRFIWHFCTRPRTVDEIAGALRDAFDDVPPEAVDRDVRDFLAQMTARGFIGTVEPPTGSGS